MKPSHALNLLLVGSLLLTSWAFAKDFDAAVKRVVPQGVELGISVAKLKENRPSVFDGPTAASKQRRFYKTFMETQGLGSPGYVSYWYLSSNDRIIGIIKTKALVGLDEALAIREAQGLYSEFIQNLGDSSQEKILRKGIESFVPVRVDIWSDPVSGLKIYFVATDKEITLAALKSSDFPVDQVFIRPDAQRFPIEMANKQTIHDLERENLKRVLVPSGVSETINSNTDRSERTLAPNTSQSKARSIKQMSYDASSSSTSNSWIYTIASMALVLAVIAFLFYRKAKA